MRLVAFIETVALVCFAAFFIGAGIIAKTTSTSVEAQQEMWMMFTHIMPLVALGAAIAYNELTGILKRKNPAKRGISLSRRGFLPSASSAS